MWSYCIGLFCYSQVSLATTHLVVPTSDLFENTAAVKIKTYQLLQTLYMYMYVWVAEFEVWNDSLSVLPDTTLGCFLVQ